MKAAIFHFNIKHVISSLFVISVYVYVCVDGCFVFCEHTLWVSEFATSVDISLVVLYVEWWLEAFSDVATTEIA